MATNRETRESSTFLAWQSHFGVQMQVSRLRQSYARDEQGSGVQRVDASGLIVQLWRLRLAAVMSQRIDGSPTSVTPAIEAFDSANPGLAKLRHVTMHFDEYALETDSRRNKIGDPARLIEARDLWDLRSEPDAFTWLEVRVDYPSVEIAARALYDAIQGDNNSQLY
ncbi:hypothetical protein [Demequina aurantiaca]|uniref:hypothetical protein n=1 Tax=Demequina aurantiaca TaxID=676200 RepID=UPI003D34A08E